MTEKIRITADDLNSDAVEAKLQQADYVQRAQQHQARQAAAAAGVVSGISLMRNSIIYMTLFGFLGGCLAWLVGEVQTVMIQPETGLGQYVASILFFALTGLTIAFFLSVAEPVVSQNWIGALVNGAVGLCCGMLGGFFVGLFIDFLYNLICDPMEELSIRQVFARSIGWAIVGLFLAIAPGVVMLNVKRLAIGLAGGFLGGLIGGALFDVVYVVTELDAISRAFSLIAIGTLAGLGTGLIENVAKRGWLYVSAGLIAGKQFIIYKDPTYIGSSPQCEIYLFKDTAVAPQHAAIRRMPGGHELRDLGNGQDTFVNGQPIKRVRLRSGDKIQVGATVFTFQEKEHH